MPTYINNIYVDTSIMPMHRYMHIRCIHPYIPTYIHIIDTHALTCRSASVGPCKFACQHLPAHPAQTYVGWCIYLPIYPCPMSCCVTRRRRQHAYPGRTSQNPGKSDGSFAQEVACKSLAQGSDFTACLELWVDLQRC